MIWRKRLDFTKINGKIIKIIFEEKSMQENTFPKERLFSLDLLRGLDMILLVVIGPLIGASNKIWHFSEPFMNQFKHFYTGFTLWDIIMPLFIFMCGAAIPLALKKRIKDGKAGSDYWKHVFSRVVMLWILGMIVQGNLLSLDRMKINFFTNTLQSIAIGYLITALSLLVSSKAVRISIPIVLALVYTLILASFGDYSEFGNAAFKVDFAVQSFLLPDKHSSLLNPNHYTWYLTSLMFGAMTLTGYHSTEILLAAKPKAKKAINLSVLGISLLAIGFISAIWIPVIKPIYTLSFTSQAMGWCVLALAFLYYLTDVKMFRKGLYLPILFGQCALTAYIVGGFFRPVLQRLSQILAQGLPHVLSFDTAEQNLAVAVITVVELTIVLIIRRRLRTR
jgi:predicted acyltransferase